MKSSVIILLLPLLCGVTVSQLRVYTFVSTEMDWYEAQNYCRQMKMDLATISSSEEQNRLLRPGVNTYSWIGLKRTGPGSNTWQWSDGQTPTFFQWAFTQGPNYEQDATQYRSSVYKTTEDCVILTGLGWITFQCSSRWSFFCYKNMTLVKENKTWEEALQYCRSRNAALASLTWDPRLADEHVSEAQTGSVWMGLHFINGKWLWVNGKEAPGVFSTTECPAPRYRCGARNSTIRVWEKRDCNEELNFLCY